MFVAFEKSRFTVNCGQNGFSASINCRIIPCYRCFHADCQCFSFSVFSRQFFLAVLCEYHCRTAHMLGGGGGGGEGGSGLEWEEGKERKDNNTSFQVIEKNLITLPKRNQHHRWYLRAYHPSVMEMSSRLENMREIEGAANGPPKIIGFVFGSEILNSILRSELILMKKLK